MAIWVNFLLWGLNAFLYYQLYQRFRGRFSFILNLIFLVGTCGAGVWLIFLDTPNVLHGDGEVSEEAFLYFIPAALFAVIVTAQIASFVFSLLTQATRQPIVRMIAQPIERALRSLLELIGRGLQFLGRILNFLLVRPVAFVVRHTFNLIGWILKILGSGLNLLVLRPLAFVARHLWNVFSRVLKVLGSGLNLLVLRPLVFVARHLWNLLSSLLKILGSGLNLLLLRPLAFVARHLWNLLDRVFKLLGQGLNTLLIQPLAFIARHLFNWIGWALKLLGHGLNFLLFRLSPLHRNIMLVALALLVVSGVGWWNYAEGNLCSWGWGPLTTCQTRTCEPLITDKLIEICFYSSNTKEDWIAEVTRAFNAQQFRTASGKTIFVKVVHVTSGGSQKDILDRKIIPTAWSPGDQSWVDDANLIWRDMTGQPLVTTACQPTIYAPIGFGMWRPMAEALGWPDKPISWNTLITLANDPKGWAAYGHPEWGPFRFGHTHPEYSNSGLLIMTTLAYDTLNLTEKLTLGEANNQAITAAMSQVEQHTYHYGVQSRDLINLMVRRGPSYLHAINTSESEIIRVNRDRGGEMRFPLAFIFPARGTFWSEQPYCLIEADWVTTEQKEAARLYRDYLLKPEQQLLAIAKGLRPLDPQIPLHAPLALENGTDPRITPQKVPALASPSANAATAIKDIFYRVKKKATIMVVVDISGSMSGDKITNATTATVNFLKRLHPDDEVSLIIFSDQPQELPLRGRAADTVEKLVPTVRELTANGQTALYDSVCLAVQRTQEWQRQHLAANENRLYGVVVLSDGEDTTSSTTKGGMFGCLPTGEDVEGIKVFTIAYGKDADKALLKQIADLTNGRTFSGDPATIEQVYLAISAEQ